VGDFDLRIALPKEASGRGLYTTLTGESFFGLAVLISDFMLHTDHVSRDVLAKAVFYYV